MCLVHLCWSAENQISPLEIEFFSFSAPSEAFQPIRHVPIVSASAKKTQQVTLNKYPKNRTFKKSFTSPELKINLPNLSATKQKLQQTLQQTDRKTENPKHEKYHGHPRNIQEIIAQGSDEERLRHYF